MTNLILGLIDTITRGSLLSHRVLILVASASLVLTFGDVDMFSGAATKVDGDNATRSTPTQVEPGPRSDQPGSVFALAKAASGDVDQPTALDAPSETIEPTPVTAETTAPAASVPEPAAAVAPVLATPVPTRAAATPAPTPAPAIPAPVAAAPTAAPQGCPSTWFCYPRLGIAGAIVPYTDCSGGTDVGTSIRAYTCLSPSYLMGHAYTQMGKITGWQAGDVVYAYGQTYTVYGAITEQSCQTPHLPLAALSMQTSLSANTCGPVLVVQAR